MTDRIAPYLLVLLIGLGAGLAIAAPSAFGADAGPDTTTLSAPADAPVDTPLVAVPAGPETPAAEQPAPASEPTADSVVAAFTGGEYLLAIAGLVWLLVGLIRRFVEPDEGWAGWQKKLLAFGLAGLAAGVLALWQGQGIGLGVFVLALGAGWAAAGVNDHVKDVTG